ncbi:MULTISPECIES: LysR family transcriptional regulator [unclassified Bradyrhizobium]|uniref:LysR family transcriptional regulator n=1 Tax=unclassified Bradyrhizobium TaxID=2631580 RepID=UPI0033929233
MECPIQEKTWSPTTHPRASTVPVEFRDLRWAIVGSQHRSLRQAAETLRIKQPTLSRCLRRLEHTLGSTLVERTNGTRPTIEGQEFLDAARRVMCETDAMTARLKTRSRGESGRLTSASAPCSQPAISGPLSSSAGTASPMSIDNWSTARETI